ncbi:MAG: glycosyltransferase family 87 protein [Solirubrobacteraceae bacterium]
MDARELSVPRLVRRALAILLLGSVLCTGPALAIMAVAVNGRSLLYDFKGGLYNAGLAILYGHSPYLPGFLAHQAAIMHAGGIAVGELAAHPFSVPVYPAVANVLIVPLSLAPLWLAGVIFTIASIAAMAAGLHLLGVRDRRCLALVALSWPLLNGLFLGAVGPLLVLGAGVAWRWRDRLWPPALAIASIVAIKIFPWTLGVWLLVTRRFRALACAVVACLAITFGAWAMIGFDGLARYPQMLTDMSYVQERRALSVVGLLVGAGVPAGAASTVAIVLALALLAVAWRLRRGPDGDRRAFGLAIIAALTGTPIVWEHYMVLLFVPIALVSPRLSRLWLVPVLTPILVIYSTWVVPNGTGAQAYTSDGLRWTLATLAAEAIVAVFLVSTPEWRSARAADLRRRVSWRPARSHSHLAIPPRRLLVDSALEHPLPAPAGSPPARRGDEASEAAA